jgi:hypothetical protein
LENVIYARWIFRDILEGGVIFEQEEIYSVRPRGGSRPEFRGQRVGGGTGYQDGRF